MTWEWERDPEIPDLLSMTEAADMIGISRQAMRKRAERGQVAGAVIGEANVWVFRRELIEQIAGPERAARFAETQRTAQKDLA